METLLLDEIDREVNYCAEQIAKTIKLDLYDKASVIFNDRQKFIDYLLGQKQDILVLSAAYRGAKRVYEECIPHIPFDRRFSHVDKSAIVLDGKNEIAFAPIGSGHALRGLKVGQVVLVHPRSISREALEVVLSSFVDSDIILYTGEI